MKTYGSLLIRRDWFTTEPYKQAIVWLRSDPPFTRSSGSLPYATAFLMSVEGSHINTKGAL